MDFDGNFAEQLRNLHHDLVFEICKRVDNGWTSAWRYNTMTKTLTVELGRLLYADTMERDDQIKAILLLANVGLVESLVLRTYIEHTFSRHRCGGHFVEWADQVDLNDFRDLIEVLDWRLVRIAFVDCMSVGYLDDIALQ